MIHLQRHPRRRLHLHCRELVKDPRSRKFAAPSNADGMFPPQEFGVGKDKKQCSWEEGQESRMQSNGAQTSGRIDREVDFAQLSIKL